VSRSATPATRLSWPVAAARSERTGRLAAVTGAAPGVGLDHAFYARAVVEVARDLIGCVVSHRGCSGVIVETEAYHDSEPASHSYVGLTDRTRPLFGPPGHAYVYLSYGIHELLNAVCEPEGVGAAVLIRALEPLRGIEQMAVNRGIRAMGGSSASLPPLSAGELRQLCSGPGKLTQALAVTRRHNDGDLATGPVVISARDPERPRLQIAASPRIGITKAVDLPWRFCAVGSRSLSRPA
jgi:DNA-3-methyladenine glycosylase